MLKFYEHNDFDYVNSVPVNRRLKGNTENNNSDYASVGESCMILKIYSWPLEYAK